MPQVNIGVEIKDKEKLGEAVFHFQKNAAYLRKKLRNRLYFIKKSRRKSNK